MPIEIKMVILIEDIALLVAIAVCLIYLRGIGNEYHQ